MALIGIRRLDGLLKQLGPAHPALRGMSPSPACFGAFCHWSSCYKPPRLCKNSDYITRNPRLTELTNGSLFQHFVKCSHNKVNDWKPESVHCKPDVYQSHRNIHSQPTGGHSQSKKHFILSPKALFKSSPNSIKPYLSLIRFDRPIGTWLLYIPCMWSITLAAPPGCLPDPTMMALFGLGSFLMRGAGCTINDMWDKDFDSKVARTKDRPLASGQLTYFQALKFLGLQLSASLAILLSMNWNTIFLGTVVMIPVIVYPLMKRVTYWPQIFLGLTFNYGAIMGWSAIQGSSDLGICLPLYGSAIAWTLVYDTIYAHQDKEDDLLIGVKSTALRMGDDTKKWLLGFGSIMISGLSVTGMLCEQTWPYFLGVGGVGAHLLYQIMSVDLNNADDCGKKFRSNRNLGLLFWASIVLANLLKKEDTQDEPQMQKNSGYKRKA